jgi:hypothetical protein
MSAPIAQTKASELIDSLNLMLHSEVDSRILAEIVTEANKLKSFGMYTDACRVLGMVASIRLNIEDINKFFNAALKNSGDNVLILANYAIALSNAYQFTRAVEIIDEVVALAPGDLRVLKEALDIHVLGFDTNGIRKLMERLHLLGTEDYQVISNEKIDGIEAVFTATKTTWALVADKIGIAAMAVAKLGKRPSSEEMYIHDGVILFKFILDAPVEYVTEAESAMIDALANEPFTSADRAIYFSCGVA